jgi:hypothetical protein
MSKLMSSRASSMEMQMALGDSWDHVADVADEKPKELARSSPTIFGRSMCWRKTYSIAEKLRVNRIVSRTSAESAHIIGISRSAIANTSARSSSRKQSCSASRRSRRVQQRTSRRNCQTRTAGRGTGAPLCRRICFTRDGASLRAVAPASGRTKQPDHLQEVPEQ